MSDIITSSGRSINTVTAEIVAISNQAAQMAYMSMIEIGKRLVEAKDLVAHGEWGSWLKNEVHFSQRTANNFMQIYERSQNGSNSQTFANLGYSQIVKLLALPDGELEEFTEAHDVQNMSVRQLDQAIKERDEARKKQSEAEAALASAQAAARDSEQRLLDLQQKVSAAKSSEDAWQKEIDKLNAKLNKATADADKAKKQLKELKANPKISDEMKEQLIQEATLKAAEQARAEVIAQLADAKAAATQAAIEKEQAEKAAASAQEEAANLRKSAQMSNPDVMAFALMGKQIAEDINRLSGYRMKIVTANPDMEAKTRAAMLDLADRLRKAAEGKQNVS